jgi:DNA-binding transcriptional LysR family regulator
MLQQQALRYFAEVARSGSLRHAAETFDIAPSAISRQIAQLEEHLDVSLFERSTRGMALTDAGAELLEHVNESDLRIQDFRRRLDDLSALRRGTVRLAVVEAVTNSFLPTILAEFSAEHPGIGFQISVCGTAEVSERILSNAAEIGLAFGSPSRDDLLLRARIAQPLQLICAPGHRLSTAGPLTLKQLDGVAAALPDRSFGIRRLIDRAASAARIRLKIALESDSLQLIKNVVAGSEIVTFMPPMTLERERAAGTLIAIDLHGSAFSRATIDVIRGRGHELSHAASRFLGFLVRAARRYG